MRIEQVNPYSNEVRYSLGLMAFHLHAARPGSVRIASHSPEMVQSVLRHVCDEKMTVLVETQKIQAEVAGSSGRMVQVIEPGSKAADAALFPFSLEEGLHPAGEQTIVAACYNALSYKSLLNPKSVKGTIFRKLAQLKPSYHLRVAAGLYSPGFILWLALAKLVERWDSARYFQLEDRAQRRLIETGPMWRLSYIVLINGRSAG